MQSRNGLTPSILILITAVLLVSCAKVTNIDACATAEYGFFSGLWHGWISPLAFIGSIFSDDIAIYAVNNNGGWYDFGFVLGAGIIGGSAGRTFKTSKP